MKCKVYDGKVITFNRGRCTISKHGGNDGAIISAGLYSEAIKKYQDANKLYEVVKSIIGYCKLQTSV